MPPAVEQVVDDRPVVRWPPQMTTTTSASIPPSSAARLHERAAAVAARAASRDRAADLLLERLEQAGREDEHDRPQHVRARRKSSLDSRLAARIWKPYAVRPTMSRPAPIGPGAFGNGELLGGACQPLYALDHERTGYSPRVGGPGAAGHVVRRRRATGVASARAEMRAGSRCESARCVRRGEHPDVHRPRGAHRRGDPGRVRDSRSSW